MNPEIPDMTPADLDAAIAREVCEWQAGEKWSDWNGDRLEDHYWLGSPMRTTRDYHPSSDIADTYAAEAEIERRGMSAAYAENLIKIAWRGKSGRSTWYLIHASPLDRCRAMLATVRAAKMEKRT